MMWRSFLSFVEWLVLSFFLFSLASLRCIGATSFEVPQPSGLIVTQRASLNGDTLQVEWQPPFCWIKEPDWQGDVEYVDPSKNIFVDTAEWYYDTSVLYKFQAEVYEVLVGESGTQEYNLVQTHTVRDEHPVYCLPKLYGSTETSRAWRTERYPVGVKLGGLTPWQKYRITVRSVVHKNSSYLDHFPAAGTTSSTSGMATLYTTPYPTAAGSGGTQMHYSGLGSAYFPSQRLESCRNRLYELGGYFPFNCEQAGVNGDYFSPEQEPSSAKAIFFEARGQIEKLNVNHEVTSPSPNALFWVNNGAPNEFYVLEESREHDRFIMDPGDLSNTNSNSTDAVTADFDGDGLMDIFITNDGQENELLLNRGYTENGYLPGTDGSYEGGSICEYIFERINGAAAGFTSSDSISSRSMAVISFDADADGDQDLLILNYEEPNQLFLNSGSGLFSLSPENFDDPGATASQGAVVFDADGDGDLDIYILNDGEENELWIDIDGNGHFVKRQGGSSTSALTAGTNAKRVVAFDINGNGRLDLFVANYGQQNQIFLNMGSNDLSLSDSDPEYEISFQLVEYETGNADGVFNAALERSDNSTDVVAIDLDHDGDLDLFVTNYLERNEILVNDGKGTFFRLNNGPLNADPSPSLGVAAFKHGRPQYRLGDDLWDFFVVNDRIPNEIFLSTKQSIWVRDEAEDATGVDRASNFALAFDADGNGVANDLLLLNENQSNQLLLNNGNGFSDLTDERAAAFRASAYATKHGALLDAHGTGERNDIFLANYLGPNQLLVKNDDGIYVDMTSSVSVLSEVDSPSRQIVIFDANMDGLDDIFVVNYGAQNELFLNSVNEGQLAFESADGGAATSSTDSLSTAAVAYDFDGDGDLDLFLAQYGQDAQSQNLLLNDGSGSFVEAGPERGFSSIHADIAQHANHVEMAYHIIDVKAVDIDLDGHMDIILLSQVADTTQSNTELQLWANNGTGYFNCTTLTIAPYGINLAVKEDTSTVHSSVAFTSLTVLDANEDGAMDLMITTMNTKNFLALNDGSGNFHLCGDGSWDEATNGDISLKSHSFCNCTDATQLSERYDMSTAAVAIDADRDGDLDLYITNYGQNNELILNCGSGYSPVANSASGGSFCSPSAFLPVLSEISPSIVDTPGGSVAVVQGRLGADPLGKVEIGNNTCELYLQSSASNWLCRIPPGSGKNLAVVVTNYGRKSAEHHNMFSYSPPKLLELDGVRPQYIGPGLQPTFTILGSNFGPRVSDKHVTFSAIDSLGTTMHEFPCENIEALPSTTAEDFGLDNSDLGSSFTLHEAFLCSVLDPGFWSHYWVYSPQITISPAETTEVLLGVNIESPHAQSMIKVGSSENQICHIYTHATTCRCNLGYSHTENPGQLQCQPCGQNKYSPEGVVCELCPEESITQVQNIATSINACECLGNSILHAGSGVCECIEGYGRDESCSPCGSSAYKGWVGNDQCTACPPGSSIGGDVTNATSSDSCLCGVNAEMNDDTGRCECAAGYGGDATVSNIGCSACGSSAYKGWVGNDQCTACPPGSSIGGDVSNATNVVSCLCGINAELDDDTGRCECAAGYGGDATDANIGCSACGSSAYKGGVGNTGCTACPPGSSIGGDVTNATSVVSCLCGINAELDDDTGRCECAAGYGGDATIPNIGCSACVSSAYKGWVGNDQCTACPLGSTIGGDVTNATSVDSCLCGINAELDEGAGRCKCLAGYGGDATNANIGCSACGGSSYKGKTKNTLCTACPPGSYIGGGVTNATSLDSCLCGINAEMNADTERCECAAGYGGDATVPNIGCSACGSSAYKEDVGNTGCTPCPFGSSIGGGVTNATFVNLCMCDINAEMKLSIDRFLDEEAQICVCAAGYGGDATVQTVGCSPCGSSAYKKKQENSPCTACPPGSTIGGDVTNATSSDSCLCGVNAEMNNETGRCECLTGYGGDATNANIGCSACGSSAYKGDVGNTGCTPCPLGAMIEDGTANSTSSAECSCLVNAQLNKQTQVCECLAGYGGDASNRAVGCVACGGSAYKGDAGNTGCTPCPFGSSIGGDVTNATSSSSCLCGVNAEMNDDTGRCECLAGYGGDATVQTLGCSACGSSAYKGDVGNTGCTPCPFGSTIGGDVSNATSSDSCLCGINAELDEDAERCECAAGYGGDATNANIGCSACGSSAYKGDVGNTGCTPCPLGAMIEDGTANSTSSAECSCLVNAQLDEETQVCECAAGYGGDASNRAVGCVACGYIAFKESVANIPCTLCPSGSVINFGSGFSSATSVEECSCPVGTVMVAASGSTTFTCQCGIGYFGSGLDGNCKMCPVGDYKDAEGDALSCKSCAVQIGTGATTLQQGSQSVQDCICGNGFYKGFGGGCLPCVIGAYCPGGDVSSMVALPGYWRSDPASSVFFSCENPNGYTLCMGGSVGNQSADESYSGPLCRDGHEGVLCSKCKNGYGKTYGVCSKCNSSFNASSIVFVLLAFVAFLSILYGLVSNNVKRATVTVTAMTKSQHGGRDDVDPIALSVVKIVINWLQMASIGAQIKVSANQATERFFQIQDIFNLSPWQFNSFNCMVQPDYFLKFYSTLFIPPGCVALGFCLSGLFLLMKRFGPNLAWTHFVDLFVMITQLLWFFTYSMVSQTILEIFECRELGSGLSLLSSDLSIRCDTSKHAFATKLGYAFVVVYIIGIPLQVFAQLYFYRARLQDRFVKIRYMFLFHNYRKGLYWYECMNMLRKMGLVTALVLLQEDVGTQVFALSVISMTYLTLHAYIKPYSSKTLNELETGALFVTALTLSMCSFFYSNPSGSGDNAVEVFFTWCVIGLSACLLFWSLYLVAKDGFFAIVHGKDKEGKDQDILPLDVRKDWLKEENMECGSPSQIKSLLGEGEERTTFSPMQENRNLNENPLLQMLPSSLSKNWKRGKDNNLGDYAPSGELLPENRKEVKSEAIQIANPLCRLASPSIQPMHEEEDMNRDLLPRKIMQVSKLHSSQTTEIENSSNITQNPVVGQ